MKRIVAAGRRNGKALGFMAADATWARKYRKHGFNMIATGTDQGILMAGIRGVLQSVGEKVMAFKAGSDAAISALMINPTRSRKPDPRIPAFAGLTRTPHSTRNVGTREAPKVAFETTRKLVKVCQLGEPRDPDVWSHTARAAQ